LNSGALTAPTIEILSGPVKVSRRAAALIASLLRGRKPPTLLFAVGETMSPVYRELVRLHRVGRAPVTRARTFNLDELRVPPEDPRSFRSYMERELFSKVRMPGKHVHFLRGDAGDPERECRRYEGELSRAVVDLALVGVGINGHVAYLEPGSAIAPRTTLVRLSASTRRRLAAAGMRAVPREAMTVGIETLLAAMRILMVATGREKAAAVAAALEGPVTPRWPASFVSLHPGLTVLLDRDAARELSTRRSGRPVGRVRPS
jgi:glucosamine-6-phosphate deaminase